MPRFVRPPTPMSAEEEARVQILTMPLAQAILHELSAHGPLMKGQLVTAVGASPMAVTLHLADLERAGLVTTDVDQPAGQRQGMRVHYDVERGNIVRALDLLRTYLLPERASDGAGS